MQRNVLMTTLLLILFSVSLPAQQNINLKQLDSYIDKAVKDFNLTGLSIAVVKDTSIIFKKGYGVEDALVNKPMTTKALFNIASCTKAFTAACVAILVDEGKLDWDDKVEDFVPGFKLADPYITANLNMADMLSHRSGLATFDGDLLWYRTDYSNKDVIKRMRYLPIRNNFRSDFGYQNNMFMIAGEVIKNITGKSWSDFIEEKLFTPLEMTDSRTCSEQLDEGQEIAYPHLKGKKQDLYIEDPGPAGSIYSSPDEMAHWVTMLLNGGMYKGRQILKQKIIDKLFSPQTILPVSSFLKNNGTHFYDYGLGWFLFDYSGKKIVEHSGGMPGYISKVTLVPEEKLGIIILTNDMNSLTTALRYKILDMFLNDKNKDWAGEVLNSSKEREEKLAEREALLEEKRFKNTEPSLELKAYEGLYRDKMYGDAKIEMRNGKLWLTLIPTKVKFYSPMEHWHFDTFMIKFADEFLPEGFVTFNFNSNAEITGFKIDLPNPDFNFYNLDFKKLKL